MSHLTDLALCLTNARNNCWFFSDDGKIFVGSGVGDPFGPRCHKGKLLKLSLMK